MKTQAGLSCWLGQAQSPSGGSEQAALQSHAVSGNPTINKEPTAPHGPHPCPKELVSSVRSSAALLSLYQAKPGLVKAQLRLPGLQHMDTSSAGAPHQLHSWEGNEHLETEISHTSMAVSKAIVYLGLSVLCAGGYKPF